ncbi:NAD-dependent protein deacylase [bacterium]|nr:NAD-dependent protein deacylase [bacterium]
MQVRRIVLLTGAGISAESGLGTFRDRDGLWTRHRLEDVATPDGFRRNPVLVHDFYNRRRSDLKTASPNAAHLALARLEQEMIGAGGSVTIVTQNVDDLHERAGSKTVIHMHGELLSALCGACETRDRWEADLGVETECRRCGVVGTLRPDVVWFGEIPYHMTNIQRALAACDLFVAVGTSGEVYPAAGFVEMARVLGAATLELNLEPSSSARVFDAGRYGPATEIVPVWVAETLASVPH